MAVSITQVALADYRLLTHFYKAQGSRISLSASDKVYAARALDIEYQPLVAALRLLQVDECLLLRNVLVKAECRSCGIGQQLILAAMSEQDSAVCFCFAEVSLRLFYLRLGFTELATAEAPHAIATMFDRYQKSKPQLRLFRYVMR